MMRHGDIDDDRMDGLVRQALEPNPARVRELISAARGARPRRRVRRLVWAATTVGLVVVTGVCAVIKMPWQKALPAPSQAIVISNEGGVLTVTTPSGCEWVSVARTKERGKP